MLPFVRWQWLWRSRRRLVSCGLGVMAVGLACLAYTIAVWPQPMVRGSPARLVAIGILLLPFGGYPVLVGLLSPAGAFGDHDYDDSREGRRRAWRRQRPNPTDDRPIPLAPDTGEGEAVRTTHCPACGERVAVPPAGAVECPTCRHRFAPD